MKTKQFILFLSFLTVLFYSYSCTSDYSIQPEYEIDPELIGEWYYIDSARNNPAFPRYTFHGIQISDRFINYIGVETSSGKVKLSGGKYARIILAKNKKIIREVLIDEYPIIKDTLVYSIMNNKLTLSSNWNTEIYYKTKIDDKVLQPVSSFLSAKIGDKILSNIKISSYPSAFSGLRQDNTFTLQSNLEDNYRIEILIPNFKGNGTYMLAAEKVALMRLFGDVALIEMIDSTANNTLTIEDYNEAENICSGKFHFSYPADEGTKPRIVDGLFSVPVYR